MDNKTALAIGLLVLGFFFLDYVYLDWNAPVFIGQKMALLIEKMAFWR